MNEVIFIRNVNWKSFSKMTKSGAIKKKKKDTKRYSLYSASILLLLNGRPHLKLYLFFSFLYDILHC